mgnify:CR=1 FL=1
MNEPKLPPLPEEQDLAGFMPTGHDDDAMTAYGLKCYAAGVAAERERCTRLAGAPALCLLLLKGRTNPAEAMWNAIRLGLPLPDTTGCTHPDTASIDPMDNEGRCFRCRVCGITFRKAETP